MITIKSFFEVSLYKRTLGMMFQNWTGGKSSRETVLASFSGLGVKVVVVVRKKG